MRILASKLADAARDGAVGEHEVGIMIAAPLACPLLAYSLVMLRVILEAPMGLRADRRADATRDRTLGEHERRVALALAL